MNILNIFEKELQTNLIWDNNTNNSYKTSKKSSDTYQNQVLKL